MQAILLHAFPGIDCLLQVCTMKTGHEFYVHLNLSGCLVSDGEMDKLAKCLSCRLEILVSISSAMYKSQGMMVHASNPSTEKWGQEDPWGSLISHAIQRVPSHWKDPAIKNIMNGA